MSKTIYIDVETTGLNPQKNAITQIAGIVEIDFEERERFNFLIQPHKDAEISDYALKITDKTVEELMSYPTPKTQYNNFLAILSGYVNKYKREDKFYFIGYNARFDMDFIRAFFEKQGDKYFGSWFFFPPIDVMNMAAVDMMVRGKRCKDFKLGTIAEHFGISLSNKKMHDAMTDIEVTKEMFEILNPYT